MELRAANEQLRAQLADVVREFEAQEAAAAAAHSAHAALRGAYLDSARGYRGALHALWEGYQRCSGGVIENDVRRAVTAAISSHDTTQRALVAAGLSSLVAEVGPLAIHLVPPLPGGAGTPTPRGAAAAAAATPGRAGGGFMSPATPHTGGSPAAVSAAAAAAAAAAASAQREADAADTVSALRDAVAALQAELSAALEREAAQRTDAAQRAHDAAAALQRCDAAEAAYAGLQRSVAVAAGSLSSPLLVVPPRHRPGAAGGAAGAAPATDAAPDADAELERRELEQRASRAEAANRSLARHVAALSRELAAAHASHDGQVGVGDMLREQLASATAQANAAEAARVEMASRAGAALRDMEARMEELAGELAAARQRADAADAAELSRPRNRATIDVPHGGFPPATENGSLPSARPTFPPANPPSYRHVTALVRLPGQAVLPTIAPPSPPAAAAAAAARPPPQLQTLASPSARRGSRGRSPTPHAQAHGGEGGKLSSPAAAPHARATAGGGTPGAGDARRDGLSPPPQPRRVTGRGSSGGPPGMARHAGPTPAELGRAAQQQALFS